MSKKEDATLEDNTKQIQTANSQSIKIRWHQTICSFIYMLMRIIIIKKEQAETDVTENTLERKVREWFHTDGKRDTTCYWEHLSLRKLRRGCDINSMTAQQLWLKTSKMVPQIYVQTEPLLLIIQESLHQCLTGRNYRLDRWAMTDMLRAVSLFGSRCLRDKEMLFGLTYWLSSSPR